MTTTLVILAGQSLGVPITDTNTVPAPLLAQAATRLAWTKLWYNYSASQVNKRSPFRPIRQPKNIAGNRNAIGYDAAMVGRLLDLSHTPSVLHVAAGASTLAVDWLSPAGPLCVALGQEITAAFLSTRNPTPAPVKIIVVWEQGQSDCTSAVWSAAYAADFAAFCAALRVTLAPYALGTVNFVVCQTATAIIGAAGTILPGVTVPQIAAVRAGQAAFVAGDGGNSILIDDDAFATYDFVHNTEAGGIAKGTAVADAAATFL